jgi:cytochrome c oxidase subunit 2
MKWLLPTAIILIVIGLIGLFAFSYFSFTPSQPGTPRPPMRGPITQVPPGGYASNGEQIFFTGTSSRDTITVSGGPIWFQMHGGGCATCHGSDGRGGSVVMMGRFTTPNITYKALIKEGFNDALIKRAITQGKDEKGDALSANMPRWHMSNRDLNDVIGYLKTLEP